MAFSVETLGKLMASGRNYASTFVGFVGGVGLMSAANSKGLMDSLNEIFNGLSMIVHGATSFWNVLIVAFPIIGGIMAKLASNSAKTTSQATAVTDALKDPNTNVSLEAKAAVLESVTKIEEVQTPVIKVNDPLLAQMVPSNKVQPIV